MDPYNSSTWTPQYAWGQYGGVANSAIGAGPTPAQYGNNLQQYYNANMGVLQPSLAAMIQQQYKNLGHGRSPLVNQAAALQMMQMGYTPAVQSAGSAEAYARQMQAAAAQAAMRFPYASGGGGQQRYDDGRSTYDNPMGGEYRESGGLTPDTKQSSSSQPSSYTAIQDTTRPTGSSAGGGSSMVSGATSGNNSDRTFYGGLYNNGKYVGGATNNFLKAYGQSQGITSGTPNYANNQSGGFGANYGTDPGSGFVTSNQSPQIMGQAGSTSTDYRSP